MATPRFAWGIDVGNRALKAVKLVRDGSGAMRVDDVDVIEHEHILSDAGDNKEALVTTALNAFAAKHPEKGGAVAIGVSGQSSFARFIKLPPVEPKKIPEIVRFEAIQQIPFPLDDVEWAYQLFQDEGSPDVEVGIFAMRKELVNQHIGNFTNAGLNVQAVQMNPLAVYNAMRYDDRIKGTTMIVDVGSENTDLIIAEGEQVWLRSIPVGGNNFTEALVKQFKLKFPKAEELKRNAATSKYTRQILQAMRPVFDSLVAEIQRSIGFYASVHRDSRIQRVIALGGTFRLPGLMKFLQMQLQLDVQRFDALGAAPPADARVATLLNDNVLSVVSPYGLALQAMGEGKITSSLLPLTIRRERMWRDKTKWFAAAAALFIAGTGVAVGRYYYDRMQYDSAESARREIATQLTAAQALDAAWKEIEASGAPERTQIASLQSLTHLRQIQAELQIAIDKALPEPAPKVEGARAERKVVMVNDQVPAYYEDLSPALATGPNGYFVMSTPEFILNATAAPGMGGGYAGYSGGTGGLPSIRARALSAGSVGSGGMPAGVYIPTGPPVGPGAAPAEGAPAAAATGKQRGFLLTLTCTTPMGNWNEVANAVSTSLIEQTKAKVGEKQPFRFERVELVSQVNLKNLPPEQRQQVTPARRNNPSGMGMPPGIQRRGPMGGPFGGGDMMEMEGYAAPRTFGGARRPPTPPTFGGRRTPGRRGATATPDPNAEDQQIYHPMPPVDFAQLKAGLNGMTPEMLNDPNQPLQILDPLNGEDATNDNRLTFLVAVVLDPAPLAPPPPAPAPAEGGEAPADGTTPPTPPAGEEAASAQ